MTATRPRGTTNRNARGSVSDRQARKLWLLTTFGDGTSAPCALAVSSKCQGTVTVDTITVDRYPVAGVDGGTYRRDNIRPACGPCNAADGARLGNSRRATR
jgi:hypothetical protein